MRCNKVVRNSDCAFDLAHDEYPGETLRVLDPVARDVDVRRHVVEHDAVDEIAVEGGKLDDVVSDAHRASDAPLRASTEDIQTGA
jgi:hypothetical protein